MARPSKTGVGIIIVRAIVEAKLFG